MRIAQRARGEWRTARRAVLALAVASAAIVIMSGLYARFGASAQDAGRPPLKGPMAGFVLQSSPAAVPEISFVDRDQKPHTLADFRGGVVLLNFWATWCGPCVQEMPSLEQLQATLATEKFRVLPVSQDRAGLPLIEEFYRNHELGGLGMFADKSGDSARRFKLRGLPTSILLDSQGREIGRFEGAADWSSPEALALIRHYLPKPVPATTQTALPPVGPSPG